MSNKVQRPDTTGIRALADEVPAIGYLATAASDDFPFTHRFAYVASHLAHTSIPQLLAYISELEGLLFDIVEHGSPYWDSAECYYCGWNPEAEEHETGCLWQQALDMKQKAEQEAGTEQEREV